MDYFLLAPPSADKLMNMMWTMQGRFWDFFNGAMGTQFQMGSNTWHILITEDPDIRLTSDWC